MTRAKTSLVLCLCLAFLLGNRALQGQAIQRLLSDDDATSPNIFNPSLQDDNLLDPDQVLQPQPDVDVPQPVQPQNLDLALNRGDAGGIGGASMMEGDSFFGSTTDVFGSGNGSYGNGGPFNLPIAGGDRRFKLSDSFSPFPTNRAIFNYHLFRDAVADASGHEDLDVNRFTFGLERTFWQNNASLEVRLPFTSGLDATQRQTGIGGPELTATELGNLVLISKYLLLKSDFYAVSAGNATSLPTARDARLIGAGFSSPTAIVENEAVHLHPFVALNFNPTPRTWLMYLTQADFDTNGNTARSFDRTGRNVANQKYNDQNLLSLDLSAGHWLKHDPCQNGIIRGLAGILELHYTTTLNNTDVVQVGPTPLDRLSNLGNRVDILNMTAAIRMLVGSRTYATFTYVTPLRTGGFDQMFENEYSFKLVRFY